jgi:tartrate-resistant acid phosphatase type 5
MKRRPSLLILVLLLLVACVPLARPIPTTQVELPVVVKQYTPTPALRFVVTSTGTPAPSATPAASPTPQASPTAAPLHFAVIGDYGEGSQNEADVANLVKSWAPDFVITVGDNNYPSGAAETIDAHIGKYYADFIYPYKGMFGHGASQNIFFPTLGNHDWDTNQAQAYFDYFSLPGNERYFDFVWGPVHFFALDSDSREPDGVAQNSVQAQWLQTALQAATEPWKIVFFHHAPYSSGTHGAVDWMRWPFAQWGANAVLAGHDHTYERLDVDGIPYFVNGVGGGAIYGFNNIDPQSQARFNADYGAMRVTATPQSILFEFITRQGSLIDTFTLQK